MSTKPTSSSLKEPWQFSFRLKNPSTSKERLVKYTSYFFIGPYLTSSFAVRFRTIPINTELKAFNDAIDVFMLDPNGHIMKRWLSRQSNLGTVSLDYELSDQPVFGEWKIRVIAQGQIEESTFLVEEYYQTRFEVRNIKKIIGSILFWQIVSVGII